MTEGRAPPAPSVTRRNHEVAPVVDVLLTFRKIARTHALVLVRSPVRSPMSDRFLDALKALLGDRYSITRELDGGGMSRVFLATEVGPPLRDRDAEQPYAAD